MRDHSWSATVTALAYIDYPHRNYGLRREYDSNDIEAAGTCTLDTVRTAGTRSPNDIFLRAAVDPLEPARFRSFVEDLIVAIP